MQIHSAPKFWATVDDNERLLSKNHKQFFDFLGQLSGFMLERNSPTVGAFIETTKEQATSVGSVTVCN